MSHTTGRTEESTRLTPETEVDLLALTAFVTIAVLGLGERFHDLSGAVVAFVAAALVLTRRAPDDR